MKPVKTKEEPQPTAESKPSLEAPYILRIQSKRDSDVYIEIGLKEMDDQTYMLAQSLIRKDKELEAAKFLIKNLRISGAQPEEITDNFRRLQAAIYPLMEFLSPMDGELKKN